MAMKMLEAGGLELLVDGVRHADESNPKGYYEFEPVKSLDKGADRSWLKLARGKAVKIICFLLTYLPATNHYKLIFMHRNLDEVIISQNKMLSRRGEPTGAAGGPSDEELRRLYQQHLDRVRSFIAARSCFEVLDVDYQNVVASPGVEAARICRFLELPLDLTRMSAVADPQLYRNRR